MHVGGRGARELHRGRADLGRLVQPPSCRHCAGRAAARQHQLALRQARPPTLSHRRLSNRSFQCSIKTGTGSGARTEGAARTGWGATVTKCASVSGSAGQMGARQKIGKRGRGAPLAAHVAHKKRRCVGAAKQVIMGGGSYQVGARRLVGGAASGGLVSSRQRLARDDGAGRGRPTRPLSSCCCSAAAAMLPPCLQSIAALHSRDLGSWRRLCERGPAAALPAARGAQLLAVFIGRACCRPAAPPAWGR